MQGVRRSMEHPAILSAQVYGSEAYRVRLRFEAMDTNFFVFDRNHGEIVKLLAAVQDPKTRDKLWTQEKRREMLTVLRELIRLLHNLVASAKTLVDHTRWLIGDWYADTEFLAEYQREVQERFAENEITGFVEDLRNYAMHYRLPPLTALFEVKVDAETKAQTATQTVVLEREDLQQWSRWEKGKAYLATAADKIPLGEVIERYYEDVRDFHQWMRNRLAEIHADELQWLREMSQRVQESHDRLYGTADR